MEPGLNLIYFFLQLVLYFNDKHTIPCIKPQLCTYFYPTLSFKKYL